MMSPLGDRLRGRADEDDAVALNPTPPITPREGAIKSMVTVPAALWGTTPENRRFPSLSGRTEPNTYERDPVVSLISMKPGEDPTQSSTFTAVIVNRSPGLGG